MNTLKVWTNFKQVVGVLKDDEIGRLFMMMLEYADTGCEPEEFIGNEAFIWQVAKRDIDMVANRDETNRENGKKGGRPPKTEENRTETPVIEENRTEPVKEKKRNEIKGNEEERESKEKPLKRFSPPSVEEVKAYCTERNNGVDAQTFVDFYAAKGWKVGNTPMKDWKACVRTWEQRDNSPRAAPAKPTKTVVAQQYEQRDYSGVQAALTAEQDDYYARRIAEKKAKQAQEDAEMEEWLRRDSS